MNILISWLKKHWLLVPLLLILLLLLSSAPEAIAQEYLVSRLHTRLVQLGVPVKSITIDNRLPLQISITLLATGFNETDADLWNKHMVHREASFAHKFGLDLYSYTLITVDPQGKTLDWSQVFLSPRFGFIYRQFSPGNKNLDNQKTEELLRQELDFRGMTVNELQVTTGAGSEQDVQTVKIRLSTPDLETANQAIPAIIGSLKSRLGKINQESEFSLVAICWLWILDNSGTVLLDYLYDLELGSENWGMAPGVTRDWFPHPAPTWHPTTTPTSTPPGYPPPRSSPPGTPYP